MNNNINEKSDYEKVQEIFEQHRRQVLKGFPIWMKCNVLLNSIGKMDKKNINWDYVNEILNDSNDELNYNLFDRIETYEQLLDLASDSKIAEVPEFGMPYFKKKCKVCNDEFTLTKGEILSYLKKDLKIPCRCYYCRKGIEKPKPIKQEAIEKKEEPIKTAFELAFEKAGIK